MDIGLKFWNQQIYVRDIREHVKIQLSNSYKTIPL